jgi:glycosyltransferase involved in cell wall biosynthesis
LLQRYGYLLPKVNPDSDLATEHNLKMRARVQELERAAEPHETSPAAPQTVITVGSSPSIEPSTNRGRPLRQPLSDEAGVLNNTMSPGMLSTDPEGHLSLVKAQSRESTPSALPERVNPSFPAEVAGLGSTDMPLSLAPRSPRTAMAPIAEVEPVRMDRRPNPYADVPSLYDLYVQANARSEKVERFGIEVFRNGAADPDGRLARAFERFTCSKALAVVCLCQGFIDRLRERGVAPEKLHLIPDWGNSAPVPASAQDAGFRDVHAIPPEVFLAMHTGNMGKKQNLQNLVRAAQLSRQDSGLLWLLVGDGEERATLEQEILQHNLTNIRLLPLQPPEAVPQMYAAADALLLNQRSAVEDAVIPSKLLTYMSSGRAVVAAVSDRSEAARQVRRADCGVLVPAENPDALLEGVNELRRAPALRQRLGRNGRAFAEAHFTKSRVLQSYESLFAALGFPVAERVRVASHAAAD